MQRARSHEIDEAAQRVFRNSLPLKWVLNEQVHDYGKDYLAEIANEDGELSGESFYVQLKGQQEVTSGSGGTTIKFVIDSNHARYWSKIVDLPVFLVVVDIAARKGWWIFLQGLLEEDRRWQKKGSITIKIPMSNTLDDTSSFVTSVATAKTWLRLNHPASVHESIEAQVAKMTRLDRRFDVKPTFVDDKLHMQLVPKVEVRLKVKILDVRKAEDLIDRGIATTFLPGEIIVSGSDLFARMEREGCIVQTQTILDGSVVIACRDHQGNRLPGTLEVPGQFKGGKKVLNFTGEIRRSPIRITVGPLALDVGGSVSLSANLANWNGQPLLQLAYFEQIHRFFRDSIPSADSTIVEFCLNGNTVGAIEMSVHEQLLSPDSSFCLNIMSKARKICISQGISPIWDWKYCTGTMIRNIEILHAILFEGGWVKRDSNAKVEAQIPVADLSNNFISKSPTFTSYRFVIPREFAICGENIRLDDVSHEYSHMSIRRKKKSRATNKVEIEMCGSESTVARITYGVIEPLSAEQVITDDALIVLDHNNSH